jgi:PAS domain S-box-containing protein
MNANTPEYQDLLDQFRALQLRVTRSFAIEQELINTRDQLDHELVLYKRLNHFSSVALETMSDEAFVQVVAEAVVDIFEVESSLVSVRYPKEEEQSLFYTEGASNAAVTPEDLERLFLHWCASVPENKAEILETDFLNTFNNPAGLHQCILFHCVNRSSGFNLCIAGWVSAEKAPLYPQLISRHRTIFNIFSKQVRALLENRVKSRQIARQIAQLESSETELKKLSLIATKTQNSVVITDAEGRIEWVNEAFSRITGYTLEEVKTRKPKDFLQGPERNQEPEFELLKQALSKKENVQVVLINYTKEGKPYYNQLEITPIFNAEGRVINFISLQKDITEEKKNREEMERINTRFDLVTDNAGIGIWEWDMERNLFVLNDVLLAQLGVNRTEMGGDFYKVWNSILHPEDLQKSVHRMQGLIQGAEMQQEVEYRIYRKDTNELRYLKCLTIAERDARIGLKRMMGSIVDVTETRLFERSLKEKNDQLQKANAELDQFVYSVSHDLRSPLLSVKGLIKLIFELPDLSTDVEQYLKMVDKSIFRLDDTIREILDYARNAKQELVIERFDLQEMVEEIYTELRYSVVESFQFQSCISTSAYIDSDRSRMQILLRNIIGNSVKYRRTDIENPYVSFCLEKRDQEWILEIEDNGEGISEQNIQKVFDMFYRATNTGVGTGLGLYICKEIVEKLGGRIEVRSKLKEGTVTTIFLPEF